VLGFCLLAKQSFSQCGFNPNWSSSNETCLDANDGTICCAPSGGTGPFTCTISPIAGNQVGSCFAGLPPSSTPYTVTITDGNSCQSSASFTIMENLYSPIIITPSSTAACSGNGSACVSVAGGSGSFNIDWYTSTSFSTYLGSGNCLSMPAGTYWYRVEDTTPNVPFTECVNSGPITILQGTLSFVGNVSPTTCTNPCNGYIALQLDGITLPATVSWTGASSGSQIATTSTSIINGLCAGSYQVTVSSSGCSSTQTFVVGLNTADNIISQCNNTLWNPDHFNGQNDITLGGNLIIMPGACLVIEDMTIRLRENCSIQVRSGGTVNAYNSTFDNGCGNWWLGFRVEGAVTPCDALSSRGLLYLEDCTVTSAIQGVANFRETITPYSMSNYGGRITALNTTFVDNSRDVDLRNHAAPVLNSTDNYTSFFDECAFLTNTIPIGNNSQISTRIFLSAVDDARFRSCTAVNSNLSMWNASGYLNTALTSQASAFQWVGNDVSFLKGFRRGIHSIGLHVRPDCSPQGVRITNITGTEFECAFGIYFGDVGNINILDNQFGQQPTTLTPNSLNYEAIQLKSTLASNVPIYLVRDNVIDYEGTTVGANNYINGINIDNCKGNANYVLRNAIRHCSVGLWYQGINRTAAATGAHFECNTFVGNSQDVQVTCSGVTCGALSGIAKDQADTYDGQPFDRSARNNFSASIFPSAIGNNQDDIKTSSTTALPLNGFKYTYLPVEFNSQNFDFANMYPREASISDATIEPYATQNAPFNIVEPLQDVNPIVFNFCNEINLMLPSLESIIQSNSELLIGLNEIRSIYNQLVDGGNTQELKQDVESANYYNAIALYDELVQLSPALSEEVMIAAIQKETELPAPLITAILSANPSAAKNLAVWKAIEDRSEPLDAYQKNLIKQGYYQTSIKESLESQMSALTTEIASNFSKALFYAFEHPEVYSFTDLLAMLDLSIPEHKILAGTMMICYGDETSGYDLMSEAALAANPHEAAIIEGTMQIMAIQKNTVNRDIPELTTEEKSFLSNIRDNDPCYLGPFAQTVLEIFGGERHQDLESACELLQTEKSAKRNIKEFADVRLFPNPVNNDYTTLKLGEPLNSVTIAEIWSMDAKLIQTIQLQKGQQEVAIWLNNLEKGVYLLKVTILDQPITRSIVKI
jgi:hypothetical protein